MSEPEKTLPPPLPPHKFHISLKYDSVTGELNMQGTIANEVMALGMLHKAIVMVAEHHTKTGTITSEETPNGN